MVAPSGQLIKLSSICGESDEVVLNPGIHQVPIKRREGGIPVIDVTFNDQQTFEMMVDTGASSTVLTVEMAEALELVPEGVMLVNTPSASSVPFSTTRVDSVAVGDAVANDLVVAVSPTLEIGLLGQNFFGNYDVTIKKSAIEFRVR